MGFVEPQHFPPSEEQRAAAFDRVIAPLSRSTFLSEIWGKSFHRVPGYTGKFADLLSWEELNSILEQDRVQPRLVQAGKPIDASSFMASRGGGQRLKPASFINSLSRGATLILDQVDDFAPGVREAVMSFEEILKTRTTANLYAGWRTQNGFDLHWDGQDTMILQVSGRKHWKIYRPTLLHPFKKGVEQAPKPCEDPVWDGLLEDGDLIYIPRGWWHVAFPLDEPSLHLTVTIVPPHGVDLLRWCINRLERYPEVRRNVPNPGSASDRKDYLSTIRRLVTESLTDEALETFLNNWEADIPLRAHLRLPYAPMQCQPPISEETIIRLATTYRLCMEGANGTNTVSFDANGTRWNCSADFGAALERLKGNAGVPVQELCAHLPDSRLTPKFIVFLTALAMGRVIWAEPRENS